MRACYEGRLKGLLKNWIEWCWEGVMVWGLVLEFWMLITNHYEQLSKEKGTNIGYFCLLEFRILKFFSLCNSYKYPTMSWIICILSINQIYQYLYKCMCIVILIAKNWNCTNKIKSFSHSYYPETSHIYYYTKLHEVKCSA